MLVVVVFYQKELKMSKVNFKKIAKFFLDLIFPIFCFACGQDGCYLCENCSKKIFQNIKFTCPVCQKLSFCGRTCPDCQRKTYLDGLIWIAPYQNQTIRKMIHSFKYEFAKDLAKTLASLMIKTILTSELINLFSPKKSWLIVPIPIQNKKLKERGFNQAELLAREISNQTKIPFETKILIKIKNTPSQTTLQEEERRKNVKNVFSVKNSNLIKNKNIVLVDDVVTTGATLDEAAKTLKSAGAKMIWGLALAKG